MWKVIALIAMVTLVTSPGRLLAADAKPAPDARLKQIEELGAIRGRVTFKMEELRRLMALTTENARYTSLGELYTKTRAVMQAKINAENAKAERDQALLDACTLKIQRMEEAWNRTLAAAWNTFTAGRNEQYQLVWTYIPTVSQACAYDDYWIRLELDPQVLLAASAAVEARADQVKLKLADLGAKVNRAMDEAEPIFKE